MEEDFIYIFESISIIHSGEFLIPLLIEIINKKKKQKLRFIRTHIDIKFAQFLFSYFSGEFVVHPSLKVDLKEMTKDADWMKLSSEDISREGRKHWKAPYTSVLGDSHYHKVRNTELMDLVD